MARPDPLAATDAQAWHDLQRVVDDALDLPDEAREAFVRAACGDDAVLHERARRLVAACVRAESRDGLLDAPAAMFGAPLFADLAAREGEAAGRRRVALAEALREALEGRYEIHRELGSGGMATVYLARDVRHERAVAVKMIDPRAVSPASVARFLSEIRTAARLTHPHVVGVHDSGEAHGLLYFVMPYVEGETLRARLRREGALPLVDALRLLRELADALAYAHAQGVVHRDLKPENVLLSGRHAIVADFGIAKALAAASPHGDAATDGALTTAGVAIGTAAYMAPEQARGDDAIDHRADLYALGLVAYELLAGAHPFGVRVPAAYIAAHLTETAAPLETHRPEVPPTMRALVRQLMATDRRERPESALRVLEVLDDALAATTARVRTAPRARATRTRRARRWLGALAATLAVGGGFVAWRTRTATDERRVGPSASRAAVPASAQPSVVVLPFADLTADSGDALLGDDITAAIIARLAAVPELKVISRTSAMRYKGSTAALRDIAEELAVANVVEGSVRREAGALRLTVRLVDARADRSVWAGTFDLEPHDRGGVQQEVAAQVVSALGVTLDAGDRAQFALSGTASTEAEALYRRGRFHWERRTIPDNVSAMDYFQRAIAADSSYADAYAGLADAYLTAFQLNLSPLPEAEAYTRHKWAAERALALDDHSGPAHVSFAISLWWQRNWPGAERELRRAIELRPGSAHAHYWYALLLGGEGRLDEAVHETEVAAGLDPFAVIAQQNHGWACALAAQRTCAVEAWERAVELSPSWGGVHGRLGTAYSYAGRHDDAVRELRNAIALEPRNVEMSADLASALARAGRRAEARRQLARARELKAPPIAMARAFVALGQVDSAFAWLDRTDWKWPHRATRTDPGLAPLRSDPRYARLWARVDHEMGLR